MRSASPTKPHAAMKLSLQTAVARYGSEAKAKLGNVAAAGEPEDQLRAPLERLVADLAELCGFPPGAVAAVGESALAALKTRPDYAITVRNALIGFLEIKAPGKGADPRRFRGHDKEQWEKLQPLPNLLYTDGNQFSLWRGGQPEGAIVTLDGDVETAGAALAAPDDLLALFDNFFRWEPIPPGSARELAKVSARLCRLLRAEVAEQLALGSPALTALATDWRKLLFPEASNPQFADGYAQAVTFGLLMARACDIRLSTGLDRVAKQLGQANSLIGAALRLLTDDAENQATLKTSLGTLTRVLDAVNWPTISKGDPDAWLYFYEDFLEVYDNDLRKQTGSYYTPPQVVAAMVRLVDEVLRGRQFGLPAGIAAPAVTVADPAAGTGTFLLGILRRIAVAVEADEGAGAVPPAVEAAVSRLVAFEMQLGPFAVAQLRIHAELLHLIGRPPHMPPRMFVTDTLASPYVEQEWLPSMYAPIAESRRQASKIKLQEPIMVVIGNPPYKEKAKGRGGWIEQGTSATGKAAPLAAWIPPAAWGVGAHAKHLRNLYVYFWRWATWKVFDHDPQANTGVVCFITVAGFLNGPGFQKMRDYLRRTADAIWVIDCSPEGHQPEVNTRIFQGVQQPVCIVLVARSAKADPDTPAVVRFRALPVGKREAKFEALAELSLEDDSWTECSTDWRAPFLPAATGAWATYPALAELFAYNGSGVQPKRVWVIAPDAESLIRRWQHLIEAPVEQKEALFHATLRGGKPADRHIRSVVRESLLDFEPQTTPIINERGACLPPVRYGFRSFDRQWIIPDPRVITQPNAALWRTFSAHQIYMTAPCDRSPSAGPALTFTGLVPDLHHYNGRGGRVFPLWRDRAATEPNLPPDLLGFLGKTYKTPVSAEDLLAYLAAVAAHPAYTARFQADLVQPGLRIPLTASGKLFAEAADLGRTVLWLHTFGERCTDAKAGRPAGP
ncbi:MAG TPA: type ISP restriction/modification enzyme, partial [Gemmataceae bacterium]|nr:type ISP restriction/modification enzyme [Gemmataceae bacterium]